MSAEFRAGDHVLVRARVQHVPKPDTAPAYQTYSLLLKDGQNLQTNVKNLAGEKTEDEMARKYPKGARVRANGAAGSVVEYRPGLGGVQVKLDDGRSVLAFEEDIEPEGKPAEGAKALTRPPQHKAVTGPKERTDGETVS